MLFQFNYQFLSRKQFNITPAVTATKTNNACQKLKSPEVDGPVDHVAFVIHGIGQQTEKFGFFQKHLQGLFDTTNHVVEENAPHRQINVQYVPVEWHKHIHEETDMAMDDITLRSIPSMRMVNNDYLADAFFYLSKERGQSIITHVTNTFNAAYNQFIKTNPGFSGKVVILAYSLGGIITWDILSNQARPGTTKKDIQQHSKLDLDFPALHFKPDYLFNLGSPLSAFLTVRNQDPKLYHPDPSIVFENIFHPFDPLAYRFEPMLHIDYRDKTAVLIEDSAATKGDRRQQECLYRNNNMELQQILGGNNVSSLFSTLKRYFSSGANRSNPFSFSPSKQQQQQDRDASISATSTPKLSLDCSTEYGDDEFEDESITTPINTMDADPFIYAQADAMMTGSSNYDQKKRNSFVLEEGNQTPEKKRRRKSYTQDDHLVLNTTITKSSRAVSHASTGCSNRIDYVLRPERFMGFLQKNEYVSGLTAHFSYWTNRDLMWHIVRRLEPDV
ncbi:uncharacterized protein ATC70_007200 [Mucor velutinosus]|uniref:DDHD domain-containing protein n=1 Tax=Mucor velutinosus TaxID=708070 RepID=A0AAN7D395_9FUNG|nr:hypothetical protein ATC70_007200 [Mucor velutinosus]